MAEKAIDLGRLFACPVCKAGEIHKFKTVRRLGFDSINVHCTNCTVEASEKAPGQYVLVGWPAGYGIAAKFYQDETRDASGWEANGRFILRDEIIEAIDAGKFPITRYMPPLEAPLVVQRDERAFLVLSNVRYSEDRTRRIRDNLPMSYGIRGTRMRVYIPSDSHTESALTQLDLGKFCLTNKRYAFVGAMKSTSAKVDKILTVTSYSDGFAIARSGKQRIEYFTGYSGALFGAVIRAVLREINEGPTDYELSDKGDEGQVKLLAASI